ncbi:unnamed protein product [Brassica napus]|uniref:(rape) hypothetical protein n=1 Tax=Brassica napus TaxID=3708 RepID=A0A816RQE6_BRANA|nr:unnamed protein product [Brassica napus]
MSSSRLLAVVHLVLFVVTVSSVHLVVTTSTASIDVMASPAPHVITGYAYCSLPHHIYSLHQRLHLGFLSVYSRSVNFGSPQAVKTKPFAGDPHRTPLTHPLQGTLHSIKLAVRASTIDSYSDEIGIRVTSPPLVLYTVAISPFDCGHSETHSGKCFRPQAAISFIRLVSVIFIYQITVEYSSNCNQFGPSDS